MGERVVYVSETTWLLDPAKEMLGPVADGGRIITATSPGCWGAMITPDYPSGHEVSMPVSVEGAEPGDAIVIEVEKITILSLATTSGTDSFVDGYYSGDPFVAKRCPECGDLNPETYLDGCGPESIKCKKCGKPVTPFQLEHGYTMLFDPGRTVGVTVTPEIAAEICRKASQYSALPKDSRQYSCNLLAKGDMPGVIARVRPMIGNMGTCPAVCMPGGMHAVFA
jgi:acetamidase/formamidase